MVFRGEEVEPKREKKSGRIRARISLMLGCDGFGYTRPRRVTSLCGYHMAVKIGY